MGVGALRMHRRSNNNPSSAKVIFNVQVCTDLWKTSDGATKTAWRSTEYIVEYMPAELIEEAALPILALLGIDVGR